MKKKYLIFCLLSFQIAVSQVVNIPDVNFKNALISNGVDSNNDGEIQVTEAEMVTTLNLSTQNISSLEGINSFVNINDLYCSYNLITTLDLTSLNSLNSLDLRGSSQLSSLNLGSLQNLFDLSITNTLLTSLDLSSLTSLDGTLDLIGNSQLSSLNLGNLQTTSALSITNNLLTSLDLSSLISVDTTLDLSGNSQLSSLNLGNLQTTANLSITNNLLTTLDLGSLTSVDIFLDISGNSQLSSLNIGNLQTTTDLSITNTLLTALELSSLTSVDITLDLSGNSQLSSLNLGNLQTTSVLSITNTLLTTLDLSSLTSVSVLDVRDNQFSTLDLSNIAVSDLFCSGNPITTLFLKNGVSETVDYQSLYSLQYVCADENDVISIQSIFDANSMNTVVNSYCSFIPGGNSYTIKGANKVDLDQNGCDVNDAVFPNLKYIIDDGTNTFTLISNASGNYLMNVIDGSYTITPVLDNQSYFTVTPSSFTTNFPADVSPFIQDICVSPVGTIDDVEIVIIPITSAMPGFEASYEILYKNIGTSTLSGSINFTFQDTLMTLFSTTPALDSQTSNVLTWNYTNLAPFESASMNVTFNLNTPTDSPALNGDDVLSFETNILPAIDANSDNNTFTLDQTVVNSFDPNDITCLEGDKISTQQVGGYLYYKIRFENTGTANAVNIVVKNTIDTSKFDISSLVVTKASHSVYAEITNTNTVKFIFENINLPFVDTSNDGYVLYKIKTLPSLQLGDTVDNQAEIYFDYNAPIITNIAHTVVENALGVDDFIIEDVVTFFPNPVNDFLTLKSKQNIKQISVFDSLGKVVLKRDVNNFIGTLKISTKSFSKGLYFIKIYTKEGVQIEKLIKR